MANPRACFGRGDYVLIEDGGIARFLAYCIAEPGRCIVEEWWEGRWIIQEYRATELSPSPVLTTNLEQDM